MPSRPLAGATCAVLLLLACNSRTREHQAHCAALPADACRADQTCVAIGGPDLEPDPASVAQGRRCDPGCASGGLAPACDWATPPPQGADPRRMAKDGRYCAGAPRCELQRPTPNAYNSAPGEYCVDPDPPCAGCRQVFHQCRSANLCSGVICP
jgi:hypothetical protein